MTTSDNVVTLVILLSMFVLAYVRLTNRSLKDFYHEIKDIFAEREEEINLK